MISLFECPNNGICPPPDVLGTTLYVGPYNPQFPTTSTPDQEPQQNFIVKVPSDLKANRKAQLSVTHMFLLGVSGSPASSFLCCLERRADDKIPGIASGRAGRTEQ